MSDTILALLGFATVIAVIVLLLRNVTVPALAFVSVSTITAAILVATGAFTLDEMAGFIKEGVKGVHGTAVLFIFSVLFFGVMTDAGMFDKIIGALMKKVGNNVVIYANSTLLGGATGAEPRFGDELLNSCFGQVDPSFTLPTEIARAFPPATYFCLFCSLFPAPVRCAR